MHHNQKHYDIEHPDRAKEVWLYNGNDDFLQGTHVPLFIIAFAIFLTLSLPFCFVVTNCIREDVSVTNQELIV